MAILPLLASSAGNLTKSNFTDVVINEHFNPEGWGPVTVYALLISMFVVALAYMIAEILKSPQLNAWAKNELSEFIVTALILGGLALGLTLMNTLVFDMTGGLDHFGVANDYLDQMIKAPSLTNAGVGLAEWWQTNIMNSPVEFQKRVGDLNQSYITLWVFEILSGVLGSLITGFILSAGPSLAYLRIGMSPLAGLSQLTPTILSLMDMVAVLILAFVAQKALLVFFKETMFRLFLPLGIALRAFPLSRKLGSTLIALAVTCYVVYPLTLVMNLGIYDSTPKFALSPEIIGLDSAISRLGASKEGEACNTPGPSSIECNGAPCEDDGTGVLRCKSLEGKACLNRDDCEGAPCNCGGAACDCTINPCTCQRCPVLGTACTDDSECCGTCYTDPNPPGGSTCQIFSLKPLFANLSEFKKDTYPACATPDPEFCATDSDCPCALAAGARPPCVTDYPDGQGRCASPPLSQDEVAGILNTAPSTPLRCTPWYSVKCLWTDLFNKAQATNSKITWFTPTLISYFFMPLLIPELSFNLLSAWLPGLMWAPVVAAALGIIDIVICVTFFRAFSESIGGDPTIWGLSRAI